MAETIESFVAKLQAEGVQAGQQEADRLRAEAKQQAEEITRQAQKDGEAIVADAKKQADDLLARSRTELDLAVRDAILRLQDALSRMLAAVLARKVEEPLRDHEFLGRLLHDLVMQYVEADCQRREVLKINVAPELREKLIAWALQEIGQEAVEEVRPSLDLKGTLADAGFEYTLGESTVEVTRESVVETLMDLVGPALRETLEKALSEPEK